MKNIISSIFIFLLFSTIAFSQNEVWLIDGSVYQGDGKGIVDSNKVVIIKKNKQKLVDTSEVFAIISKTDTLYLYSSDEYPLEKAKYFMQGEIDGKSYSNSDVYVAAFAAGVLSPIILSILSYSTFLSPIIPGAFTAVFSVVNTDNNTTGFKTKYKDNEEYVRGYRLSATKQKVKNMSIYSVAGLFTGIAVYAIINNN